MDRIKETLDRSNTIFSKPSSFNKGRVTHIRKTASRPGVASDRDSAIIQDVLKADPHPKGRYRWVYAQLAKKLNKYIRKYESLTAAKELSEADYVIFFNVVEFRRVLNTPYPFGELFVIVKGSPETLTPPRVVWRAKKMLFAEDAISDFIRDLKALRGEG